MKRHIGTKVIEARPMTRLEYNKYRGWELPADENGADEGYLVEYMDGGESNHPNHNGYISWSPKAQFDNAYRETTGMTFGLALEALRKGHKVTREGWNGKGMWLVLDPGTQNIMAKEGSVYFEAGVEGEFSINPHIDMKTATGEMQPGWLASQTDMLAEDWQITA